MTGMDELNRILARAETRPRPVVHPDHHNSVLRRAELRAHELEPRLVGLLTPVLERAGRDAARAFKALATDHLSASGLALTAADLGVTSRSTMICLKPTVEQAGALADPDGAAAENLHVTLAYLGELDGDLREIADVLAPVAATFAPLAGEIGGYGQFVTPSGRVGILLPDVPGLVELRVAVTEALCEAGVEYGREHGYQAHVTVDPDPEDDESELMIDRAGLPLTFTDLWVVRGDTETLAVPLVGVPAVTAAASAGEVQRARRNLEREETGLANALETGNQDAIGRATKRLAGARERLARAAGAGPGWTAPATDEILDVNALVRSLRGKTDPVRQAVAQTVMGTSLEGVGLNFDVANPFAAKILAQAASQVTHIAQTTQENVMRVVRESYDQGLSIPDTAKAIRVSMRDAAPARATLIARTELAASVNGASLAATQIVESATGDSYTKTWMTAGGARFPRHEDYDGLDGQSVSLDEYFEVGDAQLQFPGDPDGPPEEVCNCRCAMSYESPGGDTVEADAEDLALGASA